MKGESRSSPDPLPIFFSQPGKYFSGINRFTSLDLLQADVNFRAQASQSLLIIGIRLNQSQRFFDDHLRRCKFAAAHQFSDEFFLLRCQRDSHGTTITSTNPVAQLFESGKRVRQSHRPLMVANINLQTHSWNGERHVFRIRGPNNDLIEFSKIHRIILF